MILVNFALPKIQPLIMKKFLLLACVTLCAFFTSQAQNTFAPVGAEWWYAGNNFDYNSAPSTLPAYQKSTWTDHLKSIKDTVINGTNCRQLKVTRMQKNATKPDSVFVADTAFIYLYDNTDTVFVFNQKALQFTPLYIFNTPVGDTVTLPAFDTTYHSIDTFSYVMDSVKTETFGSQQLQSFYIHSFDTIGMGNALNWGFGIISPDGNLIFKGKFTKKIGGNWGNVGGLFPAVSHICLDCGVDIGFPSGKLTCYSDSTMSITLSAIPCDSILPPAIIVGVKELNISNIGINIFPNPAKDQVTISLKNALKNDLHVNISDITGHQLQSIILSKQIAELNINVAAYPAGVYLMTLESGGERYYHKMVVQK
jgi:hypothetical protein